ncbi:MAG: hypothetical protein EOP04_21600 [Proteobacteria bacterium]|nr:MAG: hypothetical protein EOP04_21600 [Pseudomonadota bacterium]
MRSNGSIHLLLIGSGLVVSLSCSSGQVAPNVPVSGTLKGATPEADDQIAKTKPEVDEESIGALTPADPDKTEDKVEPVAQPVDEKIPDPVIDPAPLPIPEPVPEPKVEPIIAPGKIQCALNASTERTIWEITGGWGEAVAALRNKNASWVSTAPKNNSTSPACVPIVATKKLILVSNFSLKDKNKVHIEVIGDQTMNFRIWKNMSSKSQVYLKENSNTATADVDLDVGSYSIVMDLWKSQQTPVGSGSSGILASVLNSSGAVIRQTENSVHWCVYEVDKDADVSAFVEYNAKALSCFTGG